MTFLSPSVEKLLRVRIYMKRHEMWYSQEAANWNEALPIGNGRLGAMVFGGV